jgi:hypothetical protein
VLGLDGVYAEGASGKPEFHPLPALEDDDVVAMAEELSRRIPALLQRRDLDPQEGDPEESDPLVRDQPGLAALVAASVMNRVSTGSNAGGRVAFCGDRIDPESLEEGYSARCANVTGFSLHANVFIPASDRARLERLIRYTARPPLATERLELLPDGRLLYRFKRAWRNGTTHAVFEPLQLLERLAALAPTPRANLVRRHGILGPAAKWRSLVVPRAAAVPVETLNPASDFGSPEAAAETGAEIEASPGRQGRNYRWAELMARVFEFDVLACEHCGGRLRILAAIQTPEAIRKILDWLRLPSKPPPVAPAILDPQLTFEPEWS